MPRKISALLALCALAGCGEPAVQMVDPSCGLFRMIYPNSEDIMSETTARAVLRHDEVYSTHCGVKK